MDDLAYCCRMSDNKLYSTTNKFKNTELSIDKTYKIVSQDYNLQTGVSVNTSIKGVVLT